MKKKVLVADDSQMIHRLYEGCLGDEFEIVHAYDGAETLLMAVDLLPDLILLDIMMPLLDGRVICKQLKKHPRTKQIKIDVALDGVESVKLPGFDVTSASGLVPQGITPPQGVAPPPPAPRRRAARGTARRSARACARRSP